ncbi:MAG: hypothetical protein VW378_04185 [bacterium]
MCDSTPSRELEPGKSGIETGGDRSPSGELEPGKSGIETGDSRSTSVGVDPDMSRGETVCDRSPLRETAVLAEKAAAAWPGTLEVPEVGEIWGLDVNCLVLSIKIPPMCNMTYVNIDIRSFYV